MLTQEDKMAQLLKAREKKEKKPYAGLKRISEKKKQEIVDNKLLLEQDEIFYKEHWAAHHHKCENCGRDLEKVYYKSFLAKKDKYLFWSLFHHLLPKRLYPQFRHTHENIAVLCFECHGKCENNIDFAPKIKLLTEQTKKILLNEI